jgi:hypothetical protein
MWQDLPLQSRLMFVGEAWGQCYKTFFVRNFLISYKARVFVRKGGKSLQETNTPAYYENL